MKEILRNPGPQCSGVTRGVHVGSLHPVCAPIVFVIISQYYQGTNPLHAMLQQPVMNALECRTLTAECMTPGSLARHTPNPRERGSGDRAYNELFWRQDLVASNQIRDSNLLLSNAFLAARAHTVGPALFAVTVTFFVIIAFRRNNSLYAWSPDPLSLEIEGCGLRD
jgi:hypothetical protein